MKIVRFSDLDFIPASHEDPADPGCLKKVLIGKDDLIKGKIMMINWSRLPKEKSFSPHYHEDMEEVFVILSGRAKIKINDEEAELSRGDTVITPIKQVHEMINIGTEDVNYIALGVSLEKGGKTINV